MLGIISDSLGKSNSEIVYHVSSAALFNARMGTVGETRRENLRKLVVYFGSVASLNRALGRSERDATLGQIVNATKDSKTGTPRLMGDRLARAIEMRFCWPRGRLDAPLEAPLFVGEPSSEYVENVVNATLAEQEKELVLLFRTLPPAARANVLGFLKGLNVVLGKEVGPPKT